MDSSPPMLQVYRDDEHASVAAPPLPLVNQQAKVVRPRWAEQSNKNKKVVRGAIATGAFIATYLFFCAWVAFANNGSLAQRGDSTAFPHRRFPWPFPGRRHPHPHPHPHPHHWPHPEVLGCTPIPTPSTDDAGTTASVELNVTLPGHAPVLLGDMLLHGDVSVVKVNQSEAETMSVNRTMLVGIKVANRTMRHPPPPPDADEDPESTAESFVLCAIQFRRGPLPPPPPPPQSVDMDVKEQNTLASSEHPPHPPHHPPHRGPPHAAPPPHPVLVAIFPALNATYPNFPGHHGPPPPPGAPGHAGETKSVEVTAAADSMVVSAWKSTIAFLFPMLSAFPHRPPHGPACSHHRPPPPPPFWVTALEVTLPKCTRVLFGHGPLPPHGPWRH